MWESVKSCSFAGSATHRDGWLSDLIRSFEGYKFAFKIAFINSASNVFYLTWQWTHQSKTQLLKANSASTIQGRGLLIVHLSPLNWPSRRRGQGFTISSCASSAQYFSSTFAPNSRNCPSLSTRVCLQTLVDKEERLPLLAWLNSIFSWFERDKTFNK